MVVQECSEPWLKVRQLVVLPKGRLLSRRVLVLPDRRRHRIRMNQIRKGMG